MSVSFSSPPEVVCVAGTEGGSYHYDVVVIGGALSGAATATLLLRKNPGLRLLIVEKNAQLTRRVGEATVEVSAYFLGRVLGLTQYLNEAHICKQGLRFWFSNDEVMNLGEASEVGGRFLARLPSYQLDRANFDEEVLRRAGLAGAEIWRPATVSKVELAPGGEQVLRVRHEEMTKTVRARWIVDASGVAALLSRKNGWWRQNQEHPTAAAWSRWRGVKDWDGLELAAKYPEWASVVNGIRGTATNHVLGDGWWSWWIPLKGGDVSVGVVFDQRLVEWPQDGGSIGDRLKAFLMKHPVGREMLCDAEYEEEDQLWRRNLAYYSTTYAGDGFVLVGDAAAFIDPFYSPGMDWISYTTSRAAAVITAARSGEAAEPLVMEYNRDLSTSYRGWFEALYKDKYEYLGEWDLLRVAFTLDLALYYLFVVSQPFRDGAKALETLPFSKPISRPFYHLMRTYNRRMAQMARRRRRDGELGRKNRKMRYLIGGFTMGPRDLWAVFKALLSWAKLEVTEGWKTWGMAAPEPAPKAEEAQRAPVAAAKNAEEPVSVS